MIPNLCYAEPCVMHSNDDGILMLSAKDGEFFCEVRSAVDRKLSFLVFGPVSQTIFRATEEHKNSA